MAAMTNSHILVQGFDYYRPGSLLEALGLLIELGPAARLLAGGTDLLVHMKMERTAPTALISLVGIPALSLIEPDDDGLSLGAMASIRTVGTLPRIVQGYQALAEACASFSSAQVETRATIGGNLANASPASDTAPALIAFDAEVEMASADVVRRMPLAEFFLAAGVPALKPGEVLTRVILPPARPGAGSAFAKVSRVANDLAKVNCAARIVREGGRVVDCRLAFGAVAPVPLRATGAEAVLAGRDWDESQVEEAARRAAAEVAPIDDLRSTAEYRREMVRVMAGETLRRAWQRAGERPIPLTPFPPREGGTAAAGGAASSLRLGDGLGEGSGEPVHLAAGEGTGAHAVRLLRGDRGRILLSVNGQLREAWVAPNDLLLNVLRDALELTGTKYGCGIGECSACTVLMDGRPVLSCLVLALEAAGHEIQTVEGLAAADGTLHPLQEAFIDHAAYQCGYCTPGMLLTAKSLLDQMPQPGEQDIRHYLRGNMCRCTGYAGIVRAVLAAAEACR